MKFRILCSTINTYECVVEAPSQQAAEAWYERCDGSQFQRLSSDDGWDFDDLVDVVDAPGEESDPATITVNADGEEITP